LGKKDKEVQAVDFSVAQNQNQTTMTQPTHENPRENAKKISTPNDPKQTA